MRTFDDLTQPEKRDYLALRDERNEVLGAISIKSGSGSDRYHRARLDFERRMQAILSDLQTAEPDSTPAHNTYSQELRREQESQASE